MLGTILDTRPKEGGGEGGKSMDDIVKDLVNDFLSKMPVDYEMKIVTE
jgi:dynein heavy chain